MKAAEALAMYRGQLDDHGETITIKRISPAAQADVKARVTGYKPDELGGGIQQGDRRVIIIAEDVTWDGGLKRGDKVLVRGRLMNIEVVDDNTRRVGSTLIAYDVAARG